MKRVRGCASSTASTLPGRPDWDLSDPNVRREWQAEDKHGLWPYGKSLKELFAGAASSS